MTLHHLSTSADMPSAPDVEHNAPRLLRRREAAAFLTGHGYKTAPATLAKLATVGGGPVFRHYGRWPVYAPADLLAWAESRCSGPVRSTSERSAA